MGVAEKESVERKSRKPTEKCYRQYVLSPKYLYFLKARTISFMNSIIKIRKLY